MPTTTSLIPVTVDGVRLDSYAYNISTKSGRDYLPSVRGSNAEAPGRHGSLYIPGKKFDDGRFLLQMWVIGANTDGTISTNALDEYRQNMDLLKRLFGKRHALLDVQATDSLGAVRQAYCEVLAAIDPEVVGTNPLGRFTVELKIPGVFWRDTTDTNYDSGAGGVNSTSTTVNNTNHAGATGIMEDLIIVVDGPATNPKVIDNATGHYVQLNEALPSGSQWNIDTSTWSSKVGVGIAFTTSGTDKTAVTSYSGQHSPRYFAMTPDATSIPIGWTCTGPSSATRLRIRGRKKYL